MTSLSITIFESAYQVPSRLDLGRVESVVAAQIADLEDDIWSLREDPEAFASAVHDEGEHSNFKLLDVNGDVDPIFGPALIGRFWSFVIRDVLFDRFTSLFLWQNILEKVQKLRCLMDEYQDPHPGYYLPDDMAMAFYELWYALEEMEERDANRLRRTFPNSPPMRNYYTRAPTTDVSTPVRSPPYRKTEDLPVAELDVITNLEFLTLKIGREECTTHKLLDLLDDHVRKNPSVKGFLSSHVCNQLGRFALSAECMQQLKLFRPWADAIQVFITEHTERLKRDYKAMTGWMETLWHLKQGTAHLQLGVPTDGRFRYPAGGMPTKENVDQMRAAEAALDRFWDTFLRSYEGVLPPRLVDVLVRRERHRTPPYTGPAKGDLDTSLGAQFRGLTIEEQKVTPATPKTKVKTRGVAAPEAEPSSPAPDAPDESQPKAKIQVNKRASKVFDALFFSADPAQRRGSGETNWTEFLYAMTSAGFSAEKMYGSVWQFRLTLSDVKSSFQIHEPHPSNKIDFWIARRIGRRLSRTYGWDRSTFVEV